MSYSPCLGASNDIVNFKIMHGRDGCLCNGLSASIGTVTKPSEVGECLLEVNGLLSLGDASGKSFASLLWVQSIGSGGPKYDAIKAVEDGVGDVTGLSSRRFGVLEHGFKHLSHNHAWLSGSIAPFNYPFLSDEHFFRL